MALEQSYSPQPAGSPSQGSGSSDKTEYWPHQKLRRCYTDYLFSKRAELDEQIDARRYYHGSQWTTDQIKALQKRKQPVMTFNRVSRKIDGVVGLIEKLRQDPKAYARTPQHAEGAELATAALRYVLDEQAWKEKSPICAADGAVDGIGGMEIDITQGDHGDAEIGLEAVDIASFFYDPRSWKDDFSDARYMGVGKFLDTDVARQLAPDAPESAFSGSGTELTSNSDRDLRWFVTEGIQKRIRVIDIWYQHNGGWCYAIFTGSGVLMEGKSYLKNEKKKDICKYVMFSGSVDQDGDRYGFVRNMKSAQDGLNAKQSKLQHMIASKRIIISQGAVDDVEKTRAEWARPDGVVVTNRNVNEGVKLDDQAFDFAGLEKLLLLNIQEIENFGPNHALTGDGGVEKNSGRAIALLQQAGMAELGPYILSYKGWKIRLYRAIWNAVQQHWKAERWVRVTDDQQLDQYIQINGLQTGPDGQPTLVNAIGSLDVDIILDEGPDHVNAMADMYETLQNVLPAIAPVLTPQKAALVVDTLIETSPLDASIKKKFREQSQQEANQPPQPDPAIMAAEAKAKIDLESQAKAALIENERAQEANAAKREGMMIDLDHKTRAANIDLDAKVVAHNLELKHTHEKNSVAVQYEEHKANRAVEHETRKANIGLDAKDKESKIRQSEMETKAKHESSVEATKNKPATDQSAAIKAIAESFSEGMKELTKSLTAPKSVKVQHDKSGRVTGAEVRPQ